MSRLKKPSRNTALYYATALIIPIIVMLLAFKELGIAPFGNNSLLNMDLWGQYFPMISNQSRSLFADNFSFTGGLGFNQFAQSGYYTNSLFNIFYKPFEGLELINAIDYMILIKFGLASLTFAAFLKYRYKKISPFYVALASAYALCSYNLAYMTQIMWTDVVILFPLIIIGVERLINENKPIFYCVVLALAIFSNFYIGFSVCIFVALYFVVTMIKGEYKRNLRQNTGVFLRFAGFSILAAALCAFSILPTYEAISATASAAAEFPTEIKSYHTFAEHIFSLFPYTKLSYEYGVPNISTGAFILILVPLYFFNKEIKVKNKVVDGALLILLYFSMNLNVLDFIWHGLHFPNQLPGRWTFMFSFVAIKMVVEGINNRKGVKIGSVLMSFGLSFVAVQFAKYALREDQLQNEQISDQFTTTIWMLVVYTVVLAIFTLKKDAIDKIVEIKSKWLNKNSEMKENELETVSREVNGEIIEIENIEAENVEIKEYKHTKPIDLVSSIQKIATIALSVILLIDIGANAVKSCSAQEGGTRVSDGVGYASVIDTLQPAVDKYACPDNDFYRSEANSGWTFDSGQLWGYNGIGFYSSVMSKGVYTFLSDVGYGHYAENISIVYNPKSPVLDSFFSIKYIYDRDRNYNSVGMNNIESTEKYDVYENKYCLPLAFAVDNRIEKWNHDEITNALEQQNQLVNSAYGSNINVFERVNAPAGQGDMQIYNITESGAYFFDQKCNVGELKYRVNDGAEMNVDKGYQKFVYVGNLNVGDVVRIYTQGGDIGSSNINMYKFNEQKYATVINRLKSQPMEIEKFSNTHITGNISLQSESLVYTSIPQDGWTVYCDGEEMETVAIGDLLIGVKVPAGTHELEFKYSTPGLAIGAVISLAYLLVLIFVIVLRKKNIKLSSLISKK